MFRIYNALGFYDSKHMFDNNIKIVHFTATPKNIIHDAHAYWGNSFITLNMNVPDSYVSLQNYMDNNQILQAKDLRTIENVIDFKQYVSEDKPGYHIIRTSRGKYHLQTIDHFKNVFSSFNNFAVPFPITPKIFGALTPTSTQKLTFLCFLIFFAF